MEYQDRAILHTVLTQLLVQELQCAIECTRFESRDALIKAVGTELDRIGKDGFENVFLKWLERHHKLIEFNGKYFVKEK